MDKQPEREQDEIVAFLMRPDTYPQAVREIERVDTHGAIIFLAGDRAYKLKRAVKLPYLDFSTVEKRRAVCERELRVNRRTAPSLYLDLLPIRRDAGGALHLGGEGAVADWVIVMKRFPQEALFDRLAASGQLDAALIAPLADTIWHFHAEAERAKGARWLPTLRQIIETIDQTLLGAEAACLNLDAETFLTALRAELARRELLLSQRQEAGYVRRCHGDLHLKNIVLENGQPVLFDALEFDDDLTNIDVLYDLAFLLMDLCHRGRRDAANIVLNRYFDPNVPPNVWGSVGLLPLFLSLRAGIRAMVGVHGLGFAAEARKVDAGQAIRDYLTLARESLRAKPPVLVCVGGLSGSGKTTVARGLAPDIGALPGAMHLRTDVERKRMFGAEPTTRLDASAYTEAVGDEVYRRVLEKASHILRAGHSAIIDAVFSQAPRRARAEQAARDAGAAFIGLWLDADPEQMAARVEQRRGDASDATREVVLRQVQAGATPPLGWTLVDARAGMDETLRRARRALALAE